MVAPRDLQEHCLVSPPSIAGTILSRPLIDMFQTWNILPFGSLNRRPRDLDHGSVAATFL